jgi:type II secretory pathway component GspD/PulD (secretin)
MAGHVALLGACVLIGSHAVAPTASAGEPSRPSITVPLGATPARPLVIPGLSGGTAQERNQPAAGTSRERAAAADAGTSRNAPGVPSLALVRVNYMAIEQPLSAALVELAALAGLSLVVEGRIDSVLVQASLIGPLQDVLDDLSRRHGFEWSLTSGTIEIIPSDGVVSRSIKTTGLNEERIASLLAAAGIEDARGRITFDPATQVLRIRGAPRFVARAEAAILVVAEKEDNINVVRFGRTSRVVGP